MSDELRAAAERCQRGLKCGDPRGHLFNAFGQCQWCRHMRLDIDAQSLADAYLAEHPADDAELVTEEWLLSVGFVTRDEWLELITDWGSVSFLTCAELNEVKIESVEASGPWVPIATRGDVRRLCRALGIQLKEGE